MFGSSMLRRCSEKSRYDTWMESNLVYYLCRCAIRCHLTLCGLVTPYADIDLGQHWLGVVRKQYWGTVVFICFTGSVQDIHLSNEFQMALPKLLPHHPRANDLTTAVSSSWPEPMLTQIYDTIWRHHNELTHWGRENGSNFADDIFKCIFLNENV